MPSIIKSVTFDCADVLALARFWAAALGTDVDEQEASSDRAYVEAAGWGGPNMWFVRVPERPRAAKNRVHFDLRAPATMAAEVERLEGLGASVARRFESNTIMTDPEGNVFCVELGPDDGAAG
jgi:Glyoxalase-like domain